jgi:hypothetical protein
VRLSMGFLGRGSVMIEDEVCGDSYFARSAANDNGDGDTWIRVDAALQRIARLIGRQKAREARERIDTANDNPPPARYDD